MLCSDDLKLANNPYFCWVRQQIAIFLSVLMLSVSFIDLIQLAAFKFNQGFIATVFCVNKDKPALKCDGKCFLKKTLNAANEDKSGRPQPPPDEKAPLMLYVSSLIVQVPIFYAGKKFIFNYQSLCLDGASFEIPHPPEQAG